MSATIDFNEPYLTLGGHGRLRFIQAGVGFDPAGNPMGLYSNTGERLGDLPDDEQPAAGSDAVENEADTAASDAPQEPEEASQDSEAEAAGKFTDAEELEICEIVTAINSMPRDDESLWTDTGRPRIGAVRERVKREVSVKCLNEALRQIEEQQ